MTAPTISSLRGNGATLHYEVRGRGPLVLLIPGGTGGAASFDGIAEDLADDGYTVVGYDPRGMSRSTLDDPDAEQHVAEHADDALRILDLLSPDEPALVFGASSGAIVALHLLTAHPERIARVVTHEPPVVEVLPDAAEHRALVARVQDTFRTQGLMPAMAVFAAGLKKDGDTKDGDTAEPEAGPELPPRAAARAEQTMADLPYFVGRIVPGFMSYAPDIRRLEGLSDRLVIAGGQDSRGELPYRSAAFLAKRLGTELQHFPGGHVGLTTHTAEFGELLRKAFRSSI
ncbi:alpha/beta hydrolase [Streptomyces filamentosus]|uniref:Alpha/beta hydrolase n=2 Tax=Streptomyces filamentosus TaxID=67294 RepID=A0ABY4UYK5_STRFL|nr:MULTISPECIES: alpha/beta fold hydrolase [Streptomyces]ESU49972.1 abhydrolase, alpha/beta hydrolase fold protein [Streptomyces sp. HCCB10043]EWS93018.1 abhydrolase [Streptomyces filamentosus NRRL 11379]MYR80047.1 alpha/beta fold hydrolase [Streptomyces sp. SID5466]USC48410.1 alpha/beta hydrolase [Streptomyces filamentosus]